MNGPKRWVIFFFFRLHYRAPEGTEPYVARLTSILTNFATLGDYQVSWLLAVSLLRERSGIFNTSFLHTLAIAHEF